MLPLTVLMSPNPPVVMPAAFRTCVATLPDDGAANTVRFNILSKSARISRVTPSFILKIRPKLILSEGLRFCR